MKTVKIDSRLFNLKHKKSNYLIRSLIILNDSEYSIMIDEPDDLLREVIANEKIELISTQLKEIDFHIELTDDDRVMVNGKFQYPDLIEAVQSITNLKRETSLIRKTKETDINIKINLDGNGISDVYTGIGFFDHMLDQIARHGNIDLQLKVEGDLHVDEHHTVEDVGIAFGEAILKALGDKRGIKRYGYFLPMDDAIVKFAMDISGRQYLKFKCKFNREFVGEFPTELTEEFFKGVVQGLKANIFIRAKGKNDHHKIEAIFKAFAKSLNEACKIDERTKGKLPTTKGLL